MRLSRNVRRKPRFVRGGDLTPMSDSFELKLGHSIAQAQNSNHEIRLTTSIARVSQVRMQQAGFRRLPTPDAAGQNVLNITTAVCSRYRDWNESCHLPKFDAWRNALDILLRDSQRCRPWSCGVACESSHPPPQLKSPDMEARVLAVGQRDTLKDA